jgi:hypothetical protein
MSNRPKAKPVKSPGRKPVALTLTPVQVRQVLALVREREMIAQEANRQIAEIGAAIDDLAATYAAMAKLPTRTYVFEQRGPEEIVLVERKEEEEAGEE